MILHWFINFGQMHEYLVYGVIVIASFIEGPILAIVCGLLLRTGFLHFWPAYLALMAGDLIGDIFWYEIGHRFGHRFVRRFGKYFNVSEDNVKAVQDIFHRYSTSVLIVSKITMGLGFALVTLITAGMARIPFRKYMLLNMVGQLIWTGVLLVVGYFLGHLYVTFDNVFARISIFALIAVVIIALFNYGKFVKSKFAGKNHS